jgi:hypothetical protein
VLSEAGVPLSWTSEGVDALFVCERVRKAAAHKRQLQRAERAMYTSERPRFLSASDDEVGGCKARSARSERSERSNQTRIARRRAEEEGGDTLFILERRRSGRLQGAIRAE